MPTSQSRRTRGLLAVMLAGLAVLFCVRHGSGPSDPPAQPEFLFASQRAAPARPKIRPTVSAGSTSAPARSPVTVPSVTLRYGSQPGELGLIRLPEQPPIGPESFALAGDGDVLIADVANERLSIFSPDGAFRRALALPGVALGDVVADAQGGVIVYDQLRRTLHQFDADGTPRSELQLHPGHIDTRGYFHVVGDAVYFADAAARDVLVAVLRDGVLAPPDPSQPRVSEGVHGASGRVYSLAVERGAVLRLTVREPGTETPALSRQLPVPGLLSARFIGEDTAGRFHVQIETLEDGAVALGVMTFDPGGQALRAFRVPENDYALWTAKLLEVQPDGTLVQFLPQREQVKIYRFVN